MCLDHRKYLIVFQKHKFVAIRTHRVPEKAKNAITNDYKMVYKSLVKNTMSNHLWPMLVKVVLIYNSKHKAFLQKEMSVIEHFLPWECYFLFCG